MRLSPSSGHLVFALLATASHVAAVSSVPQNVRNFYNAGLNGTCSHKLASGFWSSDNGPNTFSYCGDHLASSGIVYIKANMDIDCDGAQGGPADDGRCGASTDTQSVTSFQWIIERYNKGIRDLNANVHPYVVFGNDGTLPGWKTFDPKEYGIEPLSVMAVVCGDKLVYGIWGDTNGDDGEHPVVGEVSISLATACYGKGMNGNHGHSVDDVLYIAFAGKEAVPGADGADWAAGNYADFQKSIKKLGDSLVAKIGGPVVPGGPGGPGGPGHPGGPGGNHPNCITIGCDESGGGGGEKSDEEAVIELECEWPGHCAGTSCSTHDDCSDVLACVNRRCTRVSL